MRIDNPFRHLSKFEWMLWLFSLTATIAVFFIFKERDYIVLISSVIGVTSLIFCAKGMVFGQAVSIVFSVFYAIVSFSREYYGEMITYLGMNTPMAIFAVVSWIRNPYKNTAQVKVRQMNKGQISVMLFLGAIVTAIFYFILKALGTNELIVSTISIATSFIPAYMMMMRSPSYAIGYILNDIVLIVLWIIAAISDMSCVPMVVCFVLFLINDIYAYISWQRMKNMQKEII